MKKLLMRLYLFIIRPIVSHFVFNQMAKKFSPTEKKEYTRIAESQLKTAVDFGSLCNLIQRLAQEYKWVPDPAGGILDFSPEQLWLFFARKGDDCDGWAELVFQTARRIGLPSKMWVLMNGWNVSSAHVVTTVYDKGNNLYTLFNNSQMLNFPHEVDCLEVFRDKQLVVTGKYENLVYVRWK